MLTAQAATTAVKSQAPFISETVASGCYTFLISTPRVRRRGGRQAGQLGCRG